jgi:hypothetical protein
MSPLYHRLEVYVLDFENYGIDNIKAKLSNLDYYIVADHQTTSIPNWNDDHELNMTKCALETHRKYFDVAQVGSCVDIPLRDNTDLEVENKKLKEENKMLKIKLIRVRNVLDRELKDDSIS